jgi:tetratricopeptide (TPR) repeat protein
MKNFALVFCCLLLCLNLTAQENDSLSRYSIAELDSLFLKQKKPAEKLPLALAMLKKGEKELDKTDTAFAKILHKVGDTYGKLSDWLNATTNLEKAITIWQEKMPLNPGHVNCLNSLGAVYYYQVQYEKTKKYWLLCLEISKKVLGEGHPFYPECLDKLGFLYYHMGDYKSAESYSKQALDIRKNILGESHLDYGRSLNSLGILYLKMGDYKSAEPYYKQSLAILMNVLGQSHPYYAASLHNLGLLYYEIGDYKSAETNYKEALNIRKNVLGESHPDYALTLNNLGILYWKLGVYKTAESYYKQALAIKKNVLGELHPDYALSLISFGILYEEMGDYKSAEPYYKQALDIQKNVLGESHPDYATSLNNLGILYKTKGDFTTAEPLYNQSLEIIKKALGENHPSFISAQNSIAELYLKTNREKESYDIINQNLTKKAKQIADNFEWLSDNQKEAYWKNESSFFENLTSYTNEAYEKVPEFAGLNYNGALLTKSKMLEAKISSENYYREVDEIREELAYRRRLLAKMESEGTEDIERLNLLKKEADSLDKRLTLSWPEYAAQKKNLSITWNQVQEKLNKEEAAIEFVRFYNEKDSNYFYNALVLRKSDKNPQLIKLCKEKDLTAIQPKAGFSAYYPLIWLPLEKYLTEIKTIFYSPVGEISNIPLHALYPSKDNGDKIIENKVEKRGNLKNDKQAITEKDAIFLMDRFKMHQLTSTRYIAMGLKEKEQLGKSIAMVGGVNYDFLPGTSDNNSNNEKGKKKDRSSEAASGKLEFLEGTVNEVETVNSTLSTKGWQSQIFKFNEALEETILKQEGKEAKSILHISTHGYAFPEFDFKDSSISKNSLRYSFRFSKNPMVRSGLILAGGNWAWTGSDTLTKLGMEQNGILTALEVSQLNLRKTKLVVLSACETGLGKIEGSEGTFGLKRGFKLAGVEQIIVSLWSVPDKETMELMTLFYNDLSVTLNPVSSFEKAQKEMRKKYPTEPEKWAGFVLVR